MTGYETTLYWYYRCFYAYIILCASRWLFYVEKKQVFGCKAGLSRDFIVLAAILEVEFWEILDQQNHHFQAVCVWY